MDELKTLRDFIRYGASQFGRAGLSFGHSYDNALDEATQLVLHALHLPHDLSPVYAGAHLTTREKAQILGLFRRRIDERIPACYLIGEAWFAGLAFKTDARALVPRSPIAELIQAGYSPWLDSVQVERMLDLCCGGGCIGIASAVHMPDWQVDCVDLSADALALAADNVERFEVGERVRLVRSDLFAALAGERYQLIVSNPPYVTEGEYAAMPGEYSHEPRLGLTSGADGLDLPLRLLAEAADHLEPDGVLIMEVGEAERALQRLLPQVPFAWVEFRVGQMGVFVLRREDLVEHAAQIQAVWQQRRGELSTTAAASSQASTHPASANEARVGSDDVGPFDVLDP
ncbi:MAG: 50S ribosomal protein L3 N(5)-glutamine methyltransferase [Xanthomonadales bacterium]|nr:50S ribosomal protein L3 N(5)-glutamine methyltransferase [Xanthomonadales bacterium]